MVKLFVSVSDFVRKCQPHLTLSHTGVLGFVGPESFDLLQMVIHKAALVLGGIGSIMGAVLGGVALGVILEIVKEIKFSIEIAFGTLLLVFILFQPNGLVVFLKQWLPGWNEKLHYTSRKTNNKNGGKSVEKRENTKSSFKSSE